MTKFLPPEKYLEAQNVQNNSEQRYRLANLDTESDLKKAGEEFIDHYLKMKMLKKNLRHVRNSNDNLIFPYINELGDELLFPSFRQRLNRDAETLEKQRLYNYYTEKQKTIFI